MKVSRSATCTAAFSSVSLAALHLSKSFGISPWQCLHYCRNSLHFSPLEQSTNRIFKRVHHTTQELSSSNINVQTRFFKHRLAPHFYCSLHLWSVNTHTHSIIGQRYCTLDDGCSQDFARTVQICFEKDRGYDKHRCNQGGTSRYNYNMQKLEDNTLCSDWNWPMQLTSLANHITSVELLHPGQRSATLLSQYLHHQYYQITD